MKKNKWKLFPLLVCGLAFCQTSDLALPMMAECGQVQAKKVQKKKGWHTTKRGRKRYFKKGNFVKGIQKIKGKYYYFDKHGFLKTKKVTEKNYVYYINEKGNLEAYQKRSAYYYANGKKMSKVDAQDFQTLQTAKGIIKEITNAGMTKEEKLKKCFDWVISKPYIPRRTFENVKGWPAVYANDHFKLGGGNCFADAAAFAYLAKALGYKVYVCVDCDGSGGRGHAWAEIDGLAYDPLFAEAKSYSANYKAPYGVYRLYPILHIAL